LGFATADHVTVPEPVPDAPDVIVSHAAFVVAVQVIPTKVFTFTDPTAEPAPMVVLVLLRDKVDEPSWVIV
jgi:hypothetical protein